MNYLIVGLGNIGSEYENTRHNIGFMTIDAFAKKYQVDFTYQAKMKGSVAQVNIEGNRVYLLKPATYMNLSGDSAILVKNYYKIDLENVFIIHDDLDLPTGYLRLRENGSSAGHNGLKSLIAQFGSQEFKRARIGISKNPNIPTADYVLGSFSKEDIIELSGAIDLTISAITDFVSGIPFNKVMATYNKKK